MATAVWRWTLAVLALGAAFPALGQEALYLVPGGLEVAREDGSVGLLAMDEADKDETLKITGAAWGEPDEEGRMEECSAGPIDYANFANGATLHFQDGIFVGWSIGPDAKAAFSGGLSTGSIVAEIETVAGPVETFQSSLGEEFAADNLFGIASGPGTKAAIEVLWSGVSCVFR